MQSMGNTCITRRASILNNITAAEKTGEISPCAEAFFLSYLLTLFIYLFGWLVG